MRNLQKALRDAEIATHVVRSEMLKMVTELRNDGGRKEFACAELLDSHAKAAVAGVANTTGVMARVKTILQEGYDGT